MDTIESQTNTPHTCTCTNTQKVKYLPLKGRKSKSQHDTKIHLTENRTHLSTDSLPFQ